MPRRQPRKPSIGLNSCSSLTRCGDLLGRDAELLRQLGLLRLVVVRQELVQRRVEQADRHRLALQRAEDAGEVVALERQQLGERRLRASSSVVGQDHLAHRVDAVALEEHVLGAAQADALGAEGDGVARPGRAVSALVRTCSLRDLSSPLHQLLEALVTSRLLRGFERLVDQHLRRSRAARS